MATKKTEFQITVGYKAISVFMVKAETEEEAAPWLIYAVFPKILSKGFDLFGLIEEGLALDKTKL